MTFKDQFGAWRDGTSFDLHDLEILMNVALTCPYLTETFPTSHEVTTRADVPVALSNGGVIVRFW